MASTSHSYGPSCLLQAESNAFTRRASQATDQPPILKAHFFYCSSLAIDDPLSPVPPPRSGTSKPARLPPRPFSIQDNRELEAQWMKLYLKEAKSSKKSRVDHIVENGQNVESSGHPRKKGTKQSDDDDGVDSKPLQAKSSHLEGLASSLPHQNSAYDKPYLTLSDNPSHVPFDDALPLTSDEASREEVDAGLKKRRSFSPFRRKIKADPIGENYINTRSIRPNSKSPRRLIDHEPLSSPPDRDTTGTPFLRIQSRLRTDKSHSRSHSANKDASNDSDHDSSATKHDKESSGSQASVRPRLERLRSSHTQEKSHEYRISQFFGLKPVAQTPKIEVIVGVSRLHIVEIPNLKMGPIYWDPIHDVSSVVRGTWFYKETMWPVESDLANQLEKGYEFIRPWTASYIEELDSCQAIGPEAELKVTHRIWPHDIAEENQSRPSTSRDKGALSELGKSFDVKSKKAIEAADKPENRAAGTLEGFDGPNKIYAKSSVIYANGKEAQILRPNQLPSAARGRKPLAKIRKGQTVGIAIVRGYDHRAWEALYPASKRAAVAAATQERIETIRNATKSGRGRTKSCGACLTSDERPEVTDLVLVIHGIGQKLSERVESYHFTHAINAFRRQVGVEQQDSDVQPFLRDGLGSIMVLPINWRAKVKLEDDQAIGADTAEDASSTTNHYSLKDVTAESLPAVRSMISDVMLDIPYYLSHHKPVMIAGVIKEANRIYRLWCSNNPGFQDVGRVHLVTHSLGSIMALDILSSQPTKLSSIDLKSSKPRSDIFEFSTKNLFFCGSPAGFFLLLNHASLVPRADQQKVDTEGEATIPGLTGGRGKYGCLAVENLYNVMHQYDPVAYRLNATVDSHYASSLQPAFVPSALATWGQYVGSFFKANAQAATGNKVDTTILPTRPPLNQMPSTVEMETHNFTREEIAERRFFMLNENGQIDYTLKSGGGPLEIQYLNMLSAHSSYWTSQDFVRFLVMEIGRAPGRSNTIAGLRVVKKAWVKK